MESLPFLCCLALFPVHAHSGTGPVLHRVKGDGQHVAAKVRLVEHEPRRRDDGDRQIHVQRQAQQLRLVQRAERRRHAGIGLGQGDRVGDALEHLAGGDGDHQREEPQLRGDDAVEQAHREAQRDADGPDDEEGQAGLGHDDAGHAAAHRHLVAHGQVDAAADHDKADAHARDDDVGGLGDEVVQVAPGQEDRVEQGEKHDQHGKDDVHRALLVQIAASGRQLRARGFLLHRLRLLCLYAGRQAQHALLGELRA